MLSIVVPCLNAAPYIEQAIKSVRMVLSDEPFEIVVADGGSTDGTLDILRTLDLEPVQGPDESLYEGLNKAIGAAKGDYIFWLNADDVVLPALLPLVRMARREKADVATAEAEIVAGGKVIWRSDHGQRRMNFESLLFGVPTINSRVFRTGMLREVMPFHADLGLAADRDLMLRLADNATLRLSLPEVAYRYHSHPGSQTIAGSPASGLRVYSANLALAGFLSTVALDGVKSTILDSYDLVVRLGLARSEIMSRQLFRAARSAVSSVAGHPSLREWRRALALRSAYLGAGSGW